MDKRTTIERKQGKQRHGKKRSEVVLIDTNEQVKMTLEREGRSDSEQKRWKSGWQTSMFKRKKGTRLTETDKGKTVKAGS